jgi:tRNA-Thr(GGU) m(6)t(6)A37 methyltransferase TsaA
MSAYSFKPIGRIHSCFTEKFGIPRQPNLVPEAWAILDILPAFQQVEAFRELDSFSHIWVVFVFHQCYKRPWKSTVRPPRLGGNRRVGVFASRSGFRPNAIGQSVVTLRNIERGNGRLQLHLGGIDLLDGTPVLDVKPYLPYADSIPDARSGYAPDAPTPRAVVHFSIEADQACDSLNAQRYPNLKKLIVGLLSQDPRPAYKNGGDQETFGMHLWDLNIRFRVEAGKTIVTSIETPAK